MLCVKPGIQTPTSQFPHRTTRRVDHVKERVTDSGVVVVRPHVLNQITCQWVPNQTRCRPNGTSQYWPAVQCYRGAIIRLEAAWRHRLASASEAACRSTVECYRRRRQTQDSKTTLVPTLCVGGPVISWSWFTGPWSVNSYTWYIKEDLGWRAYMDTDHPQSTSVSAITKFYYGLLLRVYTWCSWTSLPRTTRRILQTIDI